MGHFRPKISQKCPDLGRTNVAPFLGVRLISGLGFKSAVFGVGTALAI